MESAWSSYMSKYGKYFPKKLLIPAILATAMGAGVAINYKSLQDMTREDLIIYWRNLVDTISGKNINHELLEIYKTLKNMLKYIKYNLDEAIYVDKKKVEKWIEFYINFRKGDKHLQESMFAFLLGKGGKIIDKFNSKKQSQAKTPKPLTSDGSLDSL